MSVRFGAALGGVLLAFAVVPAAQASDSADASAAKAKKRAASLRVTNHTTSPATVLAGSRFTVLGRVWNAKGRRGTKKGRLVFSLRESLESSSGKRLGTRKVKRLKGGKSRTFRKRVLLPADTAAGRYRLFICVRPGKRANRARCRTFVVRVTRPATPPQPPAPDNRSASEKLRSAISAEGMTAHLREFQAIADANGGNRASGFQGYGASVQYVLSQLRAAGYSPSTQVFEFVLFTELSEPIFTRTAPTPETYTVVDDFQTMSYSAAGDATGTIQAVDVNLAPPRATSSGCDMADFAGFTPGNVALIQRGTCDFAVKAVNAQNAGASAAVIFNQGNDAGRVGVVAGTLGETAQDGDPSPADVTIPVIGTSFDIGEDLATTPGAAVRVVTDTQNDLRTSTNVLADTAGGNPDNTIIVGSHLDSVDEGPGINDNGSGSAFNLELAIQMKKLGIQPANRMRFAWWGAEESGLVGATRYVAAVSDEEFERIGMNLNFDMMASPNFARFVYDGDFSDTPAPATAPDVNPGAAEIEDTFVNYFTSQGLASEPSAFDGRSDYKPFQDNGIAAGGLFSGAEVAKTAAQVVKFGGTAGMAFDPNYHQPGDTITNINATGFEQMADAGAHTAATYATDPGYRTRFNAGGGGRSVSSAKAQSSERLGDRLQR